MTSFDSRDRFLIPRLGSAVDGCVNLESRTFCPTGEIMLFMYLAINTVGVLFRIQPQDIGFSVFTSAHKADKRLIWVL